MTCWRTEDVLISQQAVATVNQRYATTTTADIKSGRSGVEGEGKGTAVFAVLFNQAIQKLC